MARRLGTGWLGRAALAIALAALLAACGGVKIRAEDQVPAPLVDALQLRAGLYYSPEFRNYVAREERWSTKWEISLGTGHVTAIDRLVRAMFSSVVPVADLTQPPQPPLDLILEPRFEEYAFVTPRDAGAELFAVTIRYRVNVYDGAGRLIDSLVLTGYGNEVAGSVSSGKPLTVATRRAIRDAGAKFATEFPEQPVVQKLVRHEPVEPLATGAAAAPAPAAIGEVPQLSGPPSAPKPAATATPAAAPAATSPAAAATAGPAAPAAPESQATPRAEPGAATETPAGNGPNEAPSMAPAGSGPAAGLEAPVPEVAQPAPVSEPGPPSPPPAPPP